MTPYEWLTRAVTGANQRELAAKDAVRRAKREDMPAALRELANAIEHADRVTRSAWLAGRADFGPGSRVQCLDPKGTPRPQYGCVRSVGSNGELLIALDSDAMPTPFSLDEWLSFFVVLPPT